MILFKSLTSKYGNIWEVNKLMLHDISFKLFKNRFVKNKFRYCLWGLKSEITIIGRLNLWHNMNKGEKMFDATKKVLFCRVSFKSKHVNKWHLSISFNSLDKSLIIEYVDSFCSIGKYTLIKLEGNSDISLSISS